MEKKLGIDPCKCKHLLRFLNAVFPVLSRGARTEGIVGGKGSADGRGFSVGCLLQLTRS